MTACIVGWAHTPFGKLDTETVESLIVKVADEALADAGISAADVDEIVLGHFNDGFSPQDFTASLVLQADAGAALQAGDPGRERLRHRLGRRASGHPGDRRGRGAVRAGGRRREDDRDAGGRDRRHPAEGVLPPEDGDTVGGFAGVFGQIAQRYFQRYGDQSDALATIAAKNHKNGVDNPYAQMRKDLGFDFCRTVSEKNPYVAPPLKRTDCSLVSDGAAALVLTDEETAQGMGKAIASAPPCR